MTTGVVNPCNLCTPLGAVLAFKGLENTISLLHGSQGCATYIRRYMISHFREPIDIASSSFSETTAIFGGKENLKEAIKNIILVYAPKVIGISTTCLSETIGEDISMYLKEIKNELKFQFIPDLIHVSTPSYSGSYVEGYNKTIKEVIKYYNNGECNNKSSQTINIFPGILSPWDLRSIKEIVNEFKVKTIIFPDYSKTLDGEMWHEYYNIPKGGTQVKDISSMCSSIASIELQNNIELDNTAGAYLKNNFNVAYYPINMPIGVKYTDNFISALEIITGNNISDKLSEERGLLIDSLRDAHKYLYNQKIAIYGYDDFVISFLSFALEIGLTPVLCASSDCNPNFEKTIQSLLPKELKNKTKAINNVDFMNIEKQIKKTKPDLLLGNSKGYKISKKYSIPLIRVGFPIHDRFGAQRLINVGYKGALNLLDRIVNVILEKKQSASRIGYTYL